MPGKSMLAVTGRPRLLSRHTSPEGGLSNPTIWQLVPLLGVIQEKAQGRSDASYDLASGVAHCPFCSILFIWSKSHSRGRGVELCLWKGGMSEDGRMCFKTTTVSAWRPE